MFFISIIFLFVGGRNCYSEESADINSNLVLGHQEWYEVQSLTNNELEHYHFGRRAGRSGGNGGFFSFYRKYKHVYDYAIINIGNTQAKVRFHNGNPKVGDCIPISVVQHNNGNSTIDMQFQKYRLNTGFNRCR